MAGLMRVTLCQFTTLKENGILSRFTLSDSIFIGCYFNDIGYHCETYFDEDIKLPLLLIAGSEFVYGLLIYFLMFMLRGEFDFVYYLMHVIIPELIYTVGVTLILYQLILWINQKLEAEEKRSASKFV